MVQQCSKRGSPQTVSQQFPMEQPGVSWALKQLPLEGWPHPPTQVERAASTQAESQRTSQQYGSKRQTASQQAGSLQLGVRCGRKHSPAQLSPQPGVPQQTTRAMVAQPESQLSVQQSGSMWQTPEQQTSSSQPAVSACSSKQLPAHGHCQAGSGWQRLRAALTQTLFHCTSQQSGSASQTTEQQVESEQPGVRWMTSQGPSPGQPPKLQQIPLAMVTQRSLQPKVQQIGSTAQTAEQHSGSEQPLVPCTASAEPVPGQPAGDAQMTLALAAQVSSQAREQQVGSMSQIFEQQLASSQAGK